VAKRKGKSRDRIRDWVRRFRSGEQPDDLKAPREKFAPRQIKLGEGRFAAAEDSELAGARQAEGMVTGFFPGGAFVRVGQEELLCGIAKTFRPPAEGERTSPLAVGDQVTLADMRAAHEGQGPGDRDRADGMILSRRLRRTVLARPLPMRGKRTDEYATESFQKVIAANMDVLLIVAATRQPRLRPVLLDRFLIIAERGDLTGVVVLNKTDLAEPDEQVLADLAQRGVETFCCSAVTGDGVDALRQRLLGYRSVLAGASGVGKSTLINALVPGADIETRPVRAKDDRGRHTTTAAIVHDLPAGGVLVDTPGLRELGLDMSATELPWYFPEFEALAPRCKFNDCTHTHEPNCAVIAAAEAKEIPFRRYERYLRLLESIDEKP